MEEKSFQQLFANFTIVQIKALSKELFDKITLLPKEEEEEERVMLQKYANS